ncbi:hypothetical protein [Glycomyces paridis]|uniref:Uncharacterized protein n=1 Tax=Glycomyces paridis TaxID=2126555 RepID=A0A4S8PF24_9ACTN|nr:hypothetical protein [Glycomyces paridis]THV27912.1 hypothetical protein E9998_13045 [Glycomyces paridis]
MISTDQPTDSEVDYATTLAAEEDREVRATHAALVDGLQDLADFLADHGPMSGLTGRYTSGYVTMSITRGLDGSTIERLDQLAAIGRALGGAEIQRTDLASVPRAYYYVERKFSDAVYYRAETTVDLDEIDDAAAALAEAIAEQGGAL